MAFKEVPNRGDGFDVGGDVGADAGGSGAAGISLAALPIATIMKMLGTDAKTAELIKNSGAALGGGGGALLGMKINSSTGGHIPDEWAAALGALSGALLAGVITKQVAPTSPTMGKNKRRSE